MGTCENHESLTRRCAATDARVDSMEDWVEKLETKIDRLQGTLNDINQQLSRAYGMARLAIWLLGAAGTGITVLKLIKG